MSRRRFRCATGQALILVALAMPLFFSVVGLVIDGSNLMVHRRMMQNAADGAALAASQDLGPYLSQPLGIPTCDNSWSSEKNDVSRKTIVQDVETYSANNKGPSTLDGGSCSRDRTRCAVASDRNCYTWPYKGNNGLVEVRLRENVHGFITGVIDALFHSSLGNMFNVGARSVASAAPVTTTTTNPGTTDPGSTSLGVTVPGSTTVTTDPDTDLGGNGVGFMMSRVCNAITYTGAGTKGGNPIGVFATNGGLNFQGAAPKKVTGLYYDEQRCTGNPAVPPSGSSTTCTSPATFPPGWGDAPPESDNNCVRNLVDLNQNNTLPINWPLKPPTVPTLKTGTYDPTTDYPDKCIDLGSGSISIGSGWPNTTTHAPGVYCVTGASTTLQFNGANLTGSTSSGSGYTFFALGGAKIGTNGGSTTTMFYWPSACGGRPTTRPRTFSCFGRTLWSNSSYDPQTLFYATYASADGACALCFNGNNGNHTGDIFAPNPASFPPTPTLTQTGALVQINGTGLAAGSGFIEAWNLNISGNTGTYQGTGTPIIIPGGTHTSISTGVTIPGTTVVGTTVGPSTQTQTTGTTLGLDE